VRRRTPLLTKAWIIALVITANAVTACAILEGIGDLQIVDDAGVSPLADASPEASSSIDGATDAGNDGNGGSDAPLEGAIDAPPGRCPSGRGPAMVVVPTIDGRTFCIDSTEVTQAQYRDFLFATAADASGQASTCTWNDSYAPQCNYAPDTNPDKPVVCIDWCDALAYCAWAGKRMCGKIGGGALPGFFGNVFDPLQSQWHAACTHGGAHAYPYGDSYDASACNGAERDAGGALVVGSISTCVGGYAGIVDMSGNVNEFENACDENEAGPQAGSCHGRGGSYGDGKDGLRCDSNSVFLVFSRSDTDPSFGIRCCAD
jgi:formylglycine-generating enzyme required for sulfatase activity